MPTAVNASPTVIASSATTQPAEKVNEIENLDETAAAEEQPAEEAATAENEQEEQKAE